MRKPVVMLCVVIAVVGLSMFVRRAEFISANIDGPFGRDSTAQVTIKTLHSAESQYYSTYGRYAASLRELSRPASGNPSAASADLISDDLAKGEKQGYRYNLQASPGGYTINADPVIRGGDRRRSFFSDQSQNIHAHSGPEQATAADPVLK